MQNHINTKSTVAEVCDLLGRKEMAERLNVGVTAVSNACVEDRFPAAWYAVILSMCQNRGIACPLCLFGWKGQPEPSQAFAPPDSQESRTVEKDRCGSE